MLLPAFWNIHPLADLPFLLNYRHYCEKEKFLQGVSVLNNTPLSLETLIKVDCLLAAGAAVTLTATRFIKPSTQCKTYDYIAAMNLRFIPDHADLEPFKNDFDFVLDCGAELFNTVHPKKGTVELTGSGTLVYKSQACALNVPIISVDDSKTKTLETFFGTAEGFVRALKQFSSVDLSNIKVVLFGYGKVGNGIIYGLSSYTSSITVIDQSDVALQKAQHNKLKAFSIYDIKQVKKAVAQADLIITAAGAPGLISTIFKREELKGKLLANVSADDDFGSVVPAEDVLGKKQPLNFQLETPTLMRYLDPSFYAHNLCVELMIKDNFSVGYHPLPTHIDEEIIGKWEKLHGENTSIASSH